MFKFIPYILNLNTFQKPFVMEKKMLPAVEFISKAFYRLIPLFLKMS